MKKNCYFKDNGITHIDYKDIKTLKKFVNAHGRITGSRHTGVSATNQRKLTSAIKNARHLGLLPFVQA